jgi:hypothetical protein
MACSELMGRYRATLNKAGHSPGSKCLPGSRRLHRPVRGHEDENRTHSAAPTRRESQGFCSIVKARRAAPRRTRRSRRAALKASRGKAILASAPDCRLPQIPYSWIKVHTFCFLIDDTLHESCVRCFACARCKRNNLNFFIFFVPGFLRDAAPSAATTKAGSSSREREFAWTKGL